MALSADELASIQATIAEYQPDASTIGRTGQASNFRAGKSSRVRLPGLPSAEYVTLYKLSFPVGTDVQVGDRVTSGATTYGITQRSAADSFLVETACCGVEMLNSAAASTTRPSAAVWSDLGTAVDNPPQLAQITLRSLFPQLFVPVSEVFAADTFGDASAETFYCLADSPQGSDHFPVEPGDEITALGSTYTVSSVKAEPAWLIIYVRETAP